MALLALLAPVAAAEADGPPITIAVPDGLSATLVAIGPEDERLTKAGSNRPGHYFHPILINGRPLTELYPADHIHHRGLFWGWRQVIIDGKPVANNWLMTGMAIRQHHAKVSKNGRTLTSVAVWSVDGRDIVQETLKGSVKGNTLDLTVELRALVSGLAIGGSPDDKEYGGISLRLVHSDRLNFESAGRSVTPTPGPVLADSTMRMTWDKGVAAPAQSISLSCTVDRRPISRWILRRETSMQNCVWPGRAAVPLPIGKPVLLGATLSVEP